MLRLEKILSNQPLKTVVCLPNWFSGCLPYGMADISPPVAAAEEAAGSPPPTIEEKAYDLVQGRAEAKTHRDCLRYKDFKKDHPYLCPDVKVRRKAGHIARQWGCTDFVCLYVHKFSG